MDFTDFASNLNLSSSGDPSDSIILGERCGYNDGYNTAVIHTNALANEFAHIAAFICVFLKHHTITSKQINQLNKLQYRILQFPLYELNHTTYTEQLQSIRSLYKVLNSQLLSVGVSQSSSSSASSPVVQLQTLASSW